VTDRDVLFAQAEAAYQVYQARLREAKAEIQARVEAETQDDLVALAETLHTLHAQGLTKELLRRATKKYGKSDEFNAIWNATTPDEVVDLRKKASVEKTKVEEPTWKWVGDGELEVPGVGVVTGVELEDGEYVVFDSAEQYDQDDYSAIIKAAREALLS